MLSGSLPALNSVPGLILRARQMPAGQSWRIVLTIALIMPGLLLIALLIVVWRRRRATPSAEDRAVAYMQVQHGHYWQPPDEPPSGWPVDPGDRAGPTTGG
jgi:hypothetical protein